MFRGTREIKELIYSRNYRLGVGEEDYRREAELRYLLEPLWAF
jgi:hypothetical protein